MGVSYLGRRRVEGHHDLPVGASLDHLDWHLRNLWDGGWKTVRDVDINYHFQLHSPKAHGRGRMLRSKVIPLSFFGHKRSQLVFNFGGVKNE